MTLLNCYLSECLTLNKRGYKRKQGRGECGRENKRVSTLLIVRYFLSLLYAYRYKSIMRLNITKIRPHDYGEYRCVSKNEMGIARGIFQVQGRHNSLFSHAYRTICSFLIFMRFRKCRVMICVSIDFRAYPIHNKQRPK